MNDEADTRKKKTSVKKESDSSGSGVSSKSSNSNSGSQSSDNDNEDSEMQDEEDDKGEANQIEVPASVIARFFKNKDNLTAFLTKITQESTHNLLDVSWLQSLY